MDGDLLAVHRTSQVTDGQIVVARIEDEVTVKRYKKGKTKRQLLLLPENQDFEPIVVDLAEQDVSIEGISVGVIRQH
jgi:repressor LexA